MADWQDLEQELDNWQDTGVPATFWWRDDDATMPSDQLSRMLKIAKLNKAPLALAVIPSTAQPELQYLLDNYPDVTVLQHGYAHINHAPAGEKKTECGLHRGEKTLIEELAGGLGRISEFKTFLPVLVPPWNRIDRAVISMLAAIGYKGVSTYGNRKSVYAAPGIVYVNTHFDVMYRGGKQGFIGTETALTDVIENLVARRTLKTDINEPAGFLTHHLAHDEQCWNFVEQFLEYLGNHKGARIINISKAIAQ